jgi:uncharacterized membrane protein
MIGDFFNAFKKGQELINSETWKNRTLLMNALVAFLAAGGGIAKGFGYDINLDSEGLAGGIVAVVALVNGVMQIVTNKNLGVSPRGGNSAPA